MCAGAVQNQADEREDDLLPQLGGPVDILDRRCRVVLSHLLLYAASGRFDLLACASAHPDTANGDCALEIAIGEHLRGTFPRTDETRCNESLSRNLGALRHAPLEIAQTNDLMLNTKDIREAALWQASSERHLSAFEMRLAAARTMMARACLDSLVSLARRLARSRSGTAAKTLAITMRSRRRHEIVKTQLCGLRRLCDFFGFCFLSGSH
jgi:hypothetical protein